MAKKKKKKTYSKSHWTTSYKTGERKAKIGFNTLDEALLFKSRNHFDGEVQPYVCPVCHLWHLGHYRDKD